MKTSTSSTTLNLRHIGLALAACAAVSGCATTANNPKDPLEGFNRAVFKFNDTLDKVALKPVATVYKSVLPSFVQTGVGNFFGNLSDVWSAANNLMQGKGEAGMSDVTRVALNSTFGLLGLLDIASEAGLRKHNEDFGQTLGKWGVKSGPYLMLPLFGPSTFRDTVALPLDMAGDIWRYKEPIYLRNIGTGTRLIDKRAALLDASNLLEGAALDRYEFVRDGFLQQRESRVFDGESAPKSKPEPKTSEVDAGAVVPLAVMPDTMEISLPVSSDAAVQELTTDTDAAHSASL